MTQIKSADNRAQQYTARIANQTGIFTKEEVETAYAIAESEAEECHVKELQELRDKAVRAFYISCNFNDGDGGCKRSKHCQLQCKNGEFFTQKLNEK